MKAELRENSKLESAIANILSAIERYERFSRARFEFEKEAAIFADSGNKLFDFVAQTPDTLLMRKSCVCTQAITLPI